MALEIKKKLDSGVEVSYWRVRFGKIYNGGSAQIQLEAYLDQATREVSKPVEVITLDGVEADGVVKAMYEAVKAYKTREEAMEPQITFEGATNV